MFTRHCSSATCQTYIFHFIKEAKTWSDAQNYCKQNYTNLATINNMEDMKQLNKSFRRDSAAAADAWIGLEKKRNAGCIETKDTREWHWYILLGTEYVVNEKNWNSGERNDAPCPENCVVMRMDGKWPCSANWSAICYDDRVILIRENKTWADALDYCREHHDDLVSISDHHMQKWAQERVKMADTPYVWLGMRYTCTLGLWFWVSGQTACYLNWAPGKGMGDCEMSAAMDKKGKWVELSDTMTLNFFCVKN
uniref:Si:dkey-83f18.7 n=1 Tax=Myripristis murdjan TaxID=586833 RepID=A0A667WNS9_9TELE